MRKKQEQLLIVQTLAKNILKWFKKIAVFGAEKKVFWAETVVASAVASRAEINGYKAYRMPSTATLQGSFELGHVIYIKNATERAESA